MIITLRILFSLIVVSMLGMTMWASSLCPLLSVPREVATHPWFLATLLDAYWSFIMGYVFIAYRETHVISRVAWFIAVLTLGSIGLAAYGLQSTFRARTSSDFFTPCSRINLLGIGLALLGAGAWAFA